MKKEFFSQNSEVPRLVHFALFIFILSFNSCSENKDDIITDDQSVSIKDKYLLEIDTNYKIHKIIYTGNSSNDNYQKEYSYFNDSIVIKKYSQNILYLTLYYINSKGLADSCIYRSGAVRSGLVSYFFYDSEGYLISKKDRIGNSTGAPVVEYTDRYEYTSGNLTKITLDPKRISLTGKYFTYSHNSQINLVDLFSFTGPWLGKLNRNLIQTFFTGGSMADTPPCTVFKYDINEEGLVEKITKAHCEMPAIAILITSLEYKILTTKE